MLPAPHAGVGWLEKPAREPSIGDSAGALRKAAEAEIDVRINNSRGSIAAGRMKMKQRFSTFLGSWLFATGVCCGG